MSSLTKRTSLTTPPPTGGKTRLVGSRAGAGGCAAPGPCVLGPELPWCTARSTPLSKAATCASRPSTWRLSLAPVLHLKKSRCRPPGRLYVLGLHLKQVHRLAGAHRGEAAAGADRHTADCVAIGRPALVGGVGGGVGGRGAIGITSADLHSRASVRRCFHGRAVASGAGGCGAGAVAGAAAGARGCCNHGPSPAKPRPTDPQPRTCPRPRPRTPGARAAAARRSPTTLRCRPRLPTPAARGPQMRARLCRRRGQAGMPQA
jgi:hypothetical protein